MRVTRRSVRTRSGIEALVLAIALAGCGTGPDSAGTVDGTAAAIWRCAILPSCRPFARRWWRRGSPARAPSPQVGTFHRGSPIHDKATLNPSIAPGMVLDPAAPARRQLVELRRHALASGRGARRRPVARRQPRSRHGGARSGDRRRAGGQRRRAGADLRQPGRPVPQQRQQSDGGDGRVAFLEPAARHLDQQRQRPPLDRQRPDRRERRRDDHRRRSQRRSAGRSAQSDRGRRLLRGRDQPRAAPRPRGSTTAPWPPPSSASRPTEPARRSSWPPRPTAASSRSTSSRGSMGWRRRGRFIRSPT